MIDTKPLS